MPHDQPATGVNVYQVNDGIGWITCDKHTYDLAIEKHILCRILVPLSEKGGNECNEIIPLPTQGQEVGSKEPTDKDRIWALEKIIATKEKERQEWADMCIRKQARIEQLEKEIEDLKPHIGKGFSSY